MRIAYITTYQGPSLLKSRPIVRNRSLSNAVKIELIASLLRANSHEVEVFSQGEVIDQEFKYYPGFSEPERFHADIPVYYASALPVRRLNALWSSWRTLQLFKSRHRFAPFDLVVIFNLKEPQVICAGYAIRRLGLPVILEYEDDRFTTISGEPAGGLISSFHNRRCRRLLSALAGCIAVSPHLLSQLPETTPKMLLRGVVANDIAEAAKRAGTARRNWILFSGTHVESNGVAQLIEAWRSAPIPGWELHITGYGQLTEYLKEKAKGVPDLTFHGLVSRQELVGLMTSAKICVNPYLATKTLGNLFAFKVIEYLAAGAHCITTHMGVLEPALEAGISYMSDNSPESIAVALRQVIENRAYERQAAAAARETYGLPAVARSLESFLKGLHALKPENRVTHQPVLRLGSCEKEDTTGKCEIMPRPSPEKPLVSILIPATNYLCNRFWVFLPGLRLIESDAASCHTIAKNTFDPS